MNYYSHRINDYRGKTAHLSLLEHGIYRQLLDTYYDTEDPIPKETELVFRRLCARTEDEQKAVSSVLNDFFELTNEGWKHGVCDENIEEYHQKADTARTNGKRGGRPPKKPNKTKRVFHSNPEETGSQANHKPITNNHKPSIPPNPQGGDEIVFPEALNCTTFKNLWKQWREHRKQIKKPMTVLAEEKSLSKLSALSLSDAIQTVENSIANGWQGIFPDKISSPQSSNGQEEELPACYRNRLG